MDQSEIDELLSGGEEPGAVAEDAVEQPKAAAYYPVSTWLVALAGVAAIGAFTTLFTVWMRGRGPDTEDTLRIGMTEYVAGRYEVAERLAESVDPSVEEAPELYRKREFLLGAAGVALAEELTEVNVRRQALDDALAHLAWLRENGFPPGRAAEGQRLLGLALGELGRYRQAIGPLEDAIAENPVYELTTLLPLAECRLRAGGVHLPRADQAIARLLELPNFPQRTLNQAWLLRSRVQTELQQWDLARETLDQIDDPEFELQVLLQEIRINLAQAKDLVRTAKIRDEGIPSAARRLLDEAIELALQVQRQSNDEVYASARLLEAMAHRALGDTERALSGFATVRQNNKLPSESVAAAMEEVELLTDMGNFSDALLTARVVIRDIGKPELFDPKWMSLEAFRTRMEAVARAMREQNAFEESIELARWLPPIVEPARAKEMQAESHQRWGDRLSELATTEAQASVAQTLRERARAEYRRAGELYADVANFHFTEPEYVSDLWNAVVSYQLGRDYEASLGLLEDYLRYEDRSLLPRGLLAKGRALLALGDLEGALVPLTDCVSEYPRDPLRYDARLLMARTQLELGMSDEPRELLDANLTDGTLRPDSGTFRDSLYVMGEAFYQEALRTHLALIEVDAAGERVAPGKTPTQEQAAAFTDNQQRIERAIDYLEKARYRDSRAGDEVRARHGTYLLGEAYRLAAFWPSVRATDPSTIETTRRRMNALRVQLLRAANAEFVTLKEQLTGKLEVQGRLAEGDQAMLRNCFMAVADTLYQIGDLAAAAEAYQGVAQEYLNQPLALEAMLQQSLCYGKLGDEAASRRVYQQAADVLTRIPEEQTPNFPRTTRYDRQQWEELLGWLQQSGA